MICPIFYASQNVNAKCKKEECAWWDEEGARCAILDFARMFSVYIECQEEQDDGRRFDPYKREENT